jgi:hypothetical protein
VLNIALQISQENSQGFPAGKKKFRKIKKNLGELGVTAELLTYKDLFLNDRSSDLQEFSEMR